MQKIFLFKFRFFCSIFSAEVPPKGMLQATHELIDYAITEGYLSSNYTLYGHRQVTATECPGQALFDEIKTWPHFKLNVTDSS